MQKKILVIEDEPAIGGMIKYALEAEDFQVTVTENGREASDAIAQQ